LLRLAMLAGGVRYFVLPVSMLVVVATSVRSLALLALAIALSLLVGGSAYACTYLFSKEVVVGVQLSYPSMNFVSAAALGRYVALFGSSSSSGFIVVANASSSGLGIYGVLRASPLPTSVALNASTLFVVQSNGAALLIYEYGLSSLEPLANMSVGSAVLGTSLGICCAAANGSVLYVAVPRYSTGPMIIKLLGSGSIAWALELSSVRSYLYSYYFSSTTRILVSGDSLYLVGSLATGLGASEYPYVARVGANGTLLWLRALPSIGAPADAAVNGTSIYLAINSGGSSIYVAKIESSGSVAWIAKLYTSGLQLNATSIAVEGGTIYLAGYNQGVPYIAALNASGYMEWVRYLENSVLKAQFYPWRVIVASTRIILVGYPSTPGYRDGLCWDYRFGPSNLSTLPSIEESSYSLYGTLYTSQSVATSNEAPNLRVEREEIAQPTRIQFRETPLTATIEISVETKQPNPSSPEMTISISPAYTTVTPETLAAYSYIKPQTLALYPTSTRVIDLGLAGYAATVRGQLVAYTNSTIEKLTLANNKAEIELQNKSIVSIAAPKNKIEKIIITYTNNTQKTACTTPKQCENLRDTLGTIDIDPATITIYLPPQAATHPGTAATLGGTANTLAPTTLTAIGIATAITTTATLTRKRRTRT